MSLDAARLDHIKELVRKRSAASVSAYVEAAIAEKEERGQLQSLLDEWDRQYGPPSEEAFEWAREVLDI